MPSQQSSGLSPGETGGESGSEGKAYRSKEQLMLRANSLKKALRQIIEQAEKGKKYCLVILQTVLSNYIWNILICTQRENVVPTLTGKHTCYLNCNYRLQVQIMSNLNLLCEHEFICLR